MVDNLPRLLYLGDVPVESSYHGSALLYRLLENYPAEKLLIAEAAMPSKVERRLPRVSYHHLNLVNDSLLRSRLNLCYATWLSLRAPGVRRVAANLAEFQPEAVLTVVHGFGWQTAAAFARQQQRPLHLIVHDDWMRMARALSWARSRLQRRFVKVYRQAATRLCVSPYMVEEFRKRYGVAGTVLFPSRSANCPQFTTASERVNQESTELVAVFAGTLDSGELATALKNLAVALHQRRGRLLLFGPHTAASLEYWGLTQANIQCEGLIDSTELIGRLRAEADLLFVPISFDRTGENMEVNFPSKLADYTAVGLPLLICGPEYSSAVRWARENDPVAEIVTDRSPESFGKALDRLNSTQHRQRLARRAVEVGQTFFSHAAAESIFFGALRNSSASSL